MTEALDRFEKFLYDQDEALSPLVRLALIHYQFEAIHPFLDGNGRIGRLLITLLLVDWKLLPLPLLYLSAYFERNRDEYYLRLLAVSQQGAWREWVLYFLRGVALQARDAAIRAKRLQDLQADWRARLHQQKSSTRALELADKLFEIPLLSIPRVQKLLGVTYHGAQNNVEKLVAAGILRATDGPGHVRSYVADEILQIVGN